MPINIKSGFVVAGLRHCHCFGTVSATYGIDEFVRCRTTQGFITTKNRFVDRKEGAVIAKKARQVNRKVKILFSEDLY